MISDEPYVLVGLMICLYNKILDSEGKREFRARHAASPFSTRPLMWRSYLAGGSGEPQIPDIL